MNEPLLSVLMPVRNAGAYLASALESVLEQTFADFECIVVNDGSTDETARVLANFARRDKRVKCISRENRGLVVSLNEAVLVSRGKYLARMDGDDLCARHRFLRQIEFLNRHPDVVCVGSAVDMLDDKGRRLKTYCPPENHDDILEEILAGNGGALIHPAVMLRRRAVLDIGGYRDNFAGYGEDWDLFLRLAEVGLLHNLREVLLGYRQHSKSYNQTRSQQQLAELACAVRETRERRGLPALSRKGGESLKIFHSPHRQWTLWALEGGEARTAIHHALADVLAAPMNRRTWGLLSYVIRKTAKEGLISLRQWPRLDSRTAV